MAQLDRRHRTEFANGPGDPCQGSDLFVLPQSEIAMRPPASSLDANGLGKHQAGAAHGKAAEMDNVPFTGETIGCRILAHGRNSDAIF